MELLCPWESPQYLIFSSNAPSLFYYSHFIAILAAVVFAYVLIFRIKESLAVRLFLATIIFFVLWTSLDILLWASNRPDLVLFYWSLQILLEMLLYSGAFYLAYVFIRQKDLALSLKAVLFLVPLPIIVLLPTTQLLPGIDISYCNAVESSFVIFYTYFVEILLIMAILKISFSEINKDNSRSKEISLFTAGLIIFLLAFSSGNIIGSLTEDWTLAQAGLFGMPIFISFLAYVVVKFKTFNIKLISTQVLVLVLWLLVGSILLVRTIEFVRVITSGTLIILIILGIQLVRSVKREVALREELQVANEGQANLLHIINHQIKGYLTKARLVFDDLLNDPKHNLSESAKPMIEQGFESVTEGVTFVQDFLNASNIERGTFTYNMVPVDFKKVVVEQAEKQKDTTKAKGLAYEINIAEGNYGMVGDVIQLGQAVRNLIDNSIKYTPQGSLSIKLEHKDNKIIFSIKDTGVGISNELKPKLFTKGGRDKDSQKINVNSTGFGLAFVKGVAEAHKGRVWAQSQGAGKGSTFYMELPANS